MAAPRAGRGRTGWPMAAHQLASAYEFFRKYAEGVDVVSGVLELAINRLRSSLPIIEHVEAREYEEPLGLVLA